MPPQHSTKREAPDPFNTAEPAPKRQHKSVSRSSPATEISAVSGSTKLPELHVPSVLHHISASKQQPSTDPNTGATSSTPLHSGSAKILSLKHNSQSPVYPYQLGQEGHTQSQSGQLEQQPQHEKKSLQEERQYLQQKEQHIQEEKRDLQRKEHQLQQKEHQLQEEKHQLQEEKHQLQEEKHQLQEEKQQLRSELKEAVEKELKMFLMESIGKVEDQIGKLEDQIGKVQDQIGKLEDQIGKLEDQIGKVQDQITEVTKQYGSVQEKLMQFIDSPEKNAQKMDSQSLWLQKIGLKKLPEWSKSKEGLWDGLKWENNVSATEYINEMLVGRFEIAQPRDGEPETFVRKLNLKGTLYGKENDQSLYLPIHTYGVFLQAVHNLEKGICAGVVVVGPPGIGKSFGLRWALLILARKGKVVLLEDAKEKTGYLFVPSTSGKYTAYSLKEFKNSKCEALRDSRNFYLFDPSQPGYPAVSRSAARTIMSASPDPGHYQELIIKAFGEKLVIEPYEAPELIAMYRLGLAREYFTHYDDKTAENNIKTRANRVGGLTRYVLCSEVSHEDRLRQVQYRLKSIAEERIDFDGTLSVDQSMNSTDPPSTLMYTQRENTPEVVNKEPKLIRNDHYRDSSRVWLHSIGILDQLWMFNFKRVLSRVLRANRSEMTPAAVEFEDLVAMVLTRPESKHEKPSTVWLQECGKSNRRWGAKNGVIIPEGLCRLSAKGNSWKGALSRLMELDSFVECRNNVGWKVVVKAALNTGVGVLLANSKTNPVWDMALAANVLINCTVSLKHTLSAGHLIQIFNALKETEGGKRLNLYILWIVPEIHREPVTTNLTWDRSCSADFKRYWKEVFENRLKQYTLVVVPEI